MSADSKNVTDSLADQLVDFDDRLNTAVDDVEMLAEIRNGIGELLSSGQNSEAEIRRVLQEHYESGGMRTETFQLVKSMLDGYSAEARPDIRRDAEMVSSIEPADDQFGATTVIPTDALKDTTADMRVQVGSMLRDRFLLQEKVAGGSMGVVYKALDRRLAEADATSRWVAVKVLSPQLAKNADALKALQQEAAKGRCLVHPHIVRFIDLDRDDDLHFIVMEWLEGRTLANILDSRDRDAIDHETAFRIARQIGDALDYAHRCGIVHADVKPDNIMISPSGDARLFDFGIARVQQSQHGRNFDPGVLGALTPAYSSMQVLTGDEPVASDDVFSLACLWYRLVAGYRVFGPRNAAEASNEGMTPQRVKGFSDSQWAALKKALSYARVTRFESVEQFIAAMHDDTPELVSVEVPQRFAAEPERRVSKAPGLFLLFLLVAGFGAWWSGYLTDWIQRVAPASQSPVVPTAVESATEQITSSDIEPDTGTAAVVVPEPEPVVVEDRQVEPDAVETAVTLVDFSQLPPPDLVVPLIVNGKPVEPLTTVVREDGAPVVIELVRDGDLSNALDIRIEEVGYTGNRSPWVAGQYALSNSGLVEFPVGQPRGRVTLAMASDPLREADQVSTLRVREAGLANSELAVLRVILEDDDQRAFEGSLPVNTVAFATSQAVIRESDPAVQLDIVRFNPDDTPIVVSFSVQDITATEGEDYFAPGSSEISFGPRQRSARLLIPLVRDSLPEGDEAFVVELTSNATVTAIDVYQRIVVMIRDGEQ